LRRFSSASLAQQVTADTASLSDRRKRFETAKEDDFGLPARCLRRNSMEETD
jgi:hypothetical protein